jgi:hypothetical protein
MVVKHPRRKCWTCGRPSYGKQCQPCFMKNTTARISLRIRKRHKRLGW